MPYSIEERNQLDFYKSLVSELRNSHINEIKESISSLPRFRDSEGVLQSFEDIISTEGLESAKLEGSLYSNVLFNHNMEGMTESEQDESAKYYDAIRNSMLTLQDTKLKKYTKSELLNNTVNRDFTELTTISTSALPSQLVSGSLLPNGEILSENVEVENGDVVTIEIGEDMVVWLIEDNKKRPFVNKEDFFNSRYSDSPIKELPLDFIKSIDDGKLIILENITPYVGTVTSGDGSTTGTTNTAQIPYNKSGNEV
jgi:hypothetical protein